MPNAKDRAAILALRRDPKISAMMAGAYAKQNAAFVENGIGRRPTSDELYIAHFLGPADAVRMISYRDAKSWMSAPDLFPAAAKANRTIFYGDGGPRSVGEVYDLLAARQHGSETASASSGAFFAGGIEFGSWSPIVEMTYQPKVAAAKPQMASMDGMSIFDMLASQGGTQVAQTETAPAKPQDWAAEIDSKDASKAAPYITIEDDGSHSMLAGLVSGSHAGPATEDTPQAMPDSPAVAPAHAAAEPPDESRLKIIHVKQPD